MAVEITKKPNTARKTPTQCQKSSEHTTNIWNSNDTQWFIKRLVLSSSCFIALQLCIMYLQQKETFEESTRRVCLQSYTQNFKYVVYTLQTSHNYVRSMGSRVSGLLITARRSSLSQQQSPTSFLGKNAHATCCGSHSSLVG